MTYIDIGLKQLKSEIIIMWDLVRSQLLKAQESFLKLDKDLAREVVLNEKRVNACELKINLDCENIFALFNPVAIDLRFVLAALKINSNLERIGDNAESIAKYVIDLNSPLDEKLLKISHIIEMYDEANLMLFNTQEAFDKENSILARSVFKIDETLDNINQKANSLVAAYIRNNPDKIEESLYTVSIIRKLERVGDQSKNIAEEIIFYIEAKILNQQAEKNIIISDTKMSYYRNRVKGLSI